MESVNAPGITSHLPADDMAEEKHTALASNASKDGDDHAVGHARIYIDPQKESKMLLKFDVGNIAQVSSATLIFRTVVVCNRAARALLHDGHP